MPPAATSGIATRDDEMSAAERAPLIANDASEGNNSASTAPAADCMDPSTAAHSAAAQALGAPPPPSPPAHSCAETTAMARLAVPIALAILLQQVGQQISVMCATGLAPARAVLVLLRWCCAGARWLRSCRGVDFVTAKHWTSSTCISRSNLPPGVHSAATAVAPNFWLRALRPVGLLASSAPRSSARPCSPTCDRVGLNTSPLQNTLL